MLGNKLKNIDGAVLIYGAHLVALECARWLIQNGKKEKITGFAVTDMSGNPDEIGGIKVKKLEEYEMWRQDLTVIIATPKKYHDAIEKVLRDRDFHHILKISLEEMSELKGKRLVLAQKDYPMLSFILEEDENDSSWLNMSEQKADMYEDGDKEKGRHYKFPTLFFLDEEQVFQKSIRLDFYEDYEKVCGQYRNLHTLPVYVNREIGAQEIQETMRIYMMFSMWDSEIAIKGKYMPWVKPLQVGSKLSSWRYGTTFDDTGNHISDKNSTFAEMTGAYWIWKNVSNVKYKGLCHYRRHFIISNEEMYSLEENQIDVLLTTPRYVPGGIGNMFLKETPIKREVYEGMLYAVKELHPEDRRDFESYMESCFYYPNNMVVAANQIYDQYCSWIFPILSRMEEIDRQIAYGYKGDRHIAYAAELLTSYYFVKNKDRYRIAITDYKFYS